MKIALLWPDYWPYIRRGTERVLHDTAGYLVRQGHQVDIIATKPGRPAVRREGDIRILYLRQISHPILIRWRLVPRFDFFGLVCLKPLLEERYDLVHLFFYSAAPAVRWLRRRQRTPYIYHVMMIPPFFGRRGDGRLSRFAINGADRLRTLSHYCETYLEQHFDAQGTVIYPPVDVETFRPTGSKDLQRPRLLFTADLRAREKGAAILATAFNHVYERRPDTVLEFAGPSMPAVDASLRRLIRPDARHAVRFHGVGTLESLPRRYHEAAVTVLPSVGEPFGMVLTESLACGTPVVGTRSGGIPEIISDPAVGTLYDFQANDWQGSARRLADALLETLTLARDPSTADRCRQHAMRFSWQTLGPQLDQLQEQALAATTKPA